MTARNLFDSLSDRPESLDPSPSMELTVAESELCLAALLTEIHQRALLVTEVMLPAEYSQRLRG